MVVQGSPASVTESAVSVYSFAILAWQRIGYRVSDDGSLSRNPSSFMIAHHKSYEYDALTVYARLQGEKTPWSQNRGHPAVDADFILCFAEDPHDVRSGDVEHA